MTTQFKLLLAAACLAVAFGSGWYVRGLVAEVDAAEVTKQIEAERGKHREYVAEVERRDAENKAKSTAAVDKVEVQREVDVRYVDREVIKYVKANATATACVVDPEWLCIVNRSLGLGCEGPAGPAR